MTTAINMRSSTMSIVFFVAIATNLISLVTAKSYSPTILDTDYGSFIDDIFAVGLLLQSTDVLDPKLILTTSEEPEWSANCVSEQIRRSDLGFDVPVAIGETLPPYSLRGTVCGIPGLVGFALHDTCAEPRKDLPPRIPNGVEYAAEMLMESDRTDWTYIAIGGQTSLQKLIRDHPEAISKIENLVVMGGNWCTGFDAYPDVPTPTAETNIGCDMAAANYVLQKAAEATFAKKQRFPAIYYVPVVTVNTLSGTDYSLITDAASVAKNNTHFNKAAKATIDFYKDWSVAARANPNILVHREAMTFDPSTESTPQFDAVAVLVAIDVVRGTPGSRVAQHEFVNGVHFVTNQQAAVAADHSDFFKGSIPEGAYTLWTGNEPSLNHKIGGERNIDGNKHPISTRCEDLTTYHFDPKIAPPFSPDWDSRLPPVTIRAALGFRSQEHEHDFFHEMALRISGRLIAQEEVKCASNCALTAEAIESGLNPIKQNASTGTPSKKVPLSSPPLEESNRWDQMLKILHSTSIL